MRNLTKFLTSEKGDTLHSRDRVVGNAIAEIRENARTTIRKFRQENLYKQRSGRVRAKRSRKNQNTGVTLCAKSFAVHFRIAAMAEFRSSLSEAIGEIPIECRGQTSR